MSYWRHFNHFIWATKNRESLITNEIDGVLRRSLLMTSEDVDMVPHAIGIMPDHIHFAVSIPPTQAIADVVKRLKGGSSHATNEHLGMVHPRFAWQRGYGAVTFGERSLDQVIAYIRDQRRHHAEQTIWNELERLPD